MAAPTIKQTAVTGSPGGSNTTVSVTLPTIVDGDSCVVFIARASNNLLTAGALTTTLGFARFALRTGSSTTAAQGEVWIATGLTAAGASGQTITFTSSQGRNWRAVAFATDALNTSQFASSGTGPTPFTWTTTGGNQSVAVPSVDTPTEALCLGFIFDQTNQARSTTGTGWTELNEGVSGSTGGNTSIAYLAISSKSVASAQTVTGPTIARDDGLNSTGTFPFGQIALVSASSNVLPTATPVQREIAGTVGELVTMQATATDPDGTIASYAWSQLTTSTSLTAPALSGSATSTATFTPTVAGAYTFQVTATDNAGGVSPAALVSVIVAPADGVVIATADGLTRGSVSL